MLSIAIDARDEVVLVRLTGELAMESTVRLREAAAPLRDDARPLVLEASGLAFVDSTDRRALRAGRVARPPDRRARAAVRWSATP